LKQKQQLELKQIEVNVLQQIQGKVGAYVAAACEKIIAKELPAELKNKIIENNIDDLAKNLSL